MTRKLNWRAIRAVAARDLMIVRRSKNVLLPIILVPLLLLVIIPGAIGFLGGAFDMGNEMDDLAMFFEAMPAGMQDQFAGYTDNQTMVVLC